MKLRIYKENFLNEDIEAVKKYYPNIDNDTFMKLIALDPTYREGSQSLGKYGKWILNLFKKGAIEDDEFETITPLLNQFTTYRNRVQNKDLNAYKSISELSDVLANVIDDDSMLTPRQKVRFLKNVKSGKVKVSAEDDYDIVFEDGKFVVYVPNTHEASMKLGKGTRWCTAHENPEWYDSYTKDDNKLYIIKNKETGSRYQYGTWNKDFLDENDTSFDLSEIYIDKELIKFMSKINDDIFVNIDISEDGTLEADSLTGISLPNVLRKQIIHLIVKATTNEIMRYSFSDCENLKTVVIENGIEFIEDHAFENCTSLVHVDLPDGLEEIDDGAFMNCESLEEINIPTSVARLGSNCFAYCNSLINVVIPEGLTEIDTGTFCGCDSLETVILPKSVRTIGDTAFKHCYELRTIDLSNVKQIYSMAFYECSSLEKILLSKDITILDDLAFSKCENLTIYTDSDMVKDYCIEYDIPVKPAKEFKNESIKKPFKLRNGVIFVKNNKQKPFKLSISEDTFRSVPIFEKLEHLGTDMFITDYVGNVVNLVKNKTDTYRILYDSKIDKYIIANSYDYTHFEMLRKAYDEGYYIDINDYIENVSDGLHNYFHDGVYGDSNDSSRTIVCYIVYPDSGTKWLYQDSYDAGYLLNADEFRFQNGARVVVGIKGNGFTDPQFFKAFGKPRILSKKELMENITKFNYLSEDTCCVASKTSYIDEDGLDKNGIYYFGKKPKTPVNWKYYKRNDNKRFKLKERLYNGIHIPPCPKEELRQLSVSKMNNITLRNPNGDESEFIVFKSKVQTKQFINSLLSDAFFPMARSQTYLNDYLHDKESYIEDMTNFYNNEAWLSDSEGQSIWAYSDGKNYLFDGTYEDAVEAIKLRNIESFIMSDSWGEYVYNAYIVFEELSNDPEDGMWRAVDGINGYLDGSYDDYRWFNYFGTYIEIPSWANSIKDILIK